MSKKIDVISLKEYADRIGYPLFEGGETTLEDIQKYAEEELDWSIFDYPEDELHHVLTEINENVCLVNTDIGLRVCEL